jgi:ribosomal protein S18 acetylase RimI-like enzyme
MSNDPIQFRFARLADLSAVVELVESCYRGDASRVGWTTEADMLDGQRTNEHDLQQELQKENHHLLLAEQDRQLMACCMLVANPDKLYFGMFSVRPNLQNQGVGKLVMQEVERLAREHFKLNKISMTVIDIRDELIAYYERRGFHRTGIYQPFPYGDARFGLPKRDDLRFEVLEKNL